MDLINMGVDVHQTNPQGQTALDCALNMIYKLANTEREYYKAGKALRPLLELLKP